jgi:hypothetical protein
MSNPDELVPDVNTPMTEEQEAKLLGDLMIKWFGECVPPYEDDCAGCWAAKLRKLLK